MAVAFCYYGSARLAYFLAFEDSPNLPTWPPAGIGFALILLLGRSSWPGITIGALIANLMAHWHNSTLTPQIVILVSCGIALSSTLEALAGSFLMKEWIHDKYPFNTTKNAFRFLFITMLICLIGATLGGGSLCLGDIVHNNFFLRVTFSLWVSNVVGILLFTPLLLSLNEKYVLKISAEKGIEVAIFIICSGVVLFVLQVDYLKSTFERALPFLILPVLLWVAYRFTLFVAISGVVVTSLFTLYMTISGHGPFLLSQPESSMLLMQIFIGVLSVSTLVLSATVKERREAQRLLLQFNANLEGMVHERTKALNDEINTRIQAEENIQRTNHELSKRNTELDNFVYSVSHDLRAPIASVLGLINLAKKDNDGNMKDMYLDLINKSALQQDHFIKEILDQSRNSRLEVKREEIFFKPLIEETFNQLKFATSTGKSVEKVINIEQRGTFYSDGWRLKVILNNIISNSIRYRNGREPVIKVNVLVDDSQAVLVIEDNGKGIGKEHLPNLCKMFYRATDDGAGSGLGLYIVKEAIDKLHGEIRIESEEGKGTTVRLFIPQLDRVE
jgi:signal transduction histidine kinase